MKTRIDPVRNNPNPAEVGCWSVSTSDRGTSNGVNIRSVYAFSEPVSDSGHALNPMWFRGFTLIELLVVLSIILVISSLSLAFVATFMRDAGIKQGARLVQSSFFRARQLAVTSRAIHFLVFVTDKEGSFRLIRLCKDADTEDEGYQSSIDKPVEEDVVLPKGVRFSTEPPLFRLPQPWLGFYPDRTMILPPGVSDQPLSDPPRPEVTDIVLEQGQRPGKMYLDFSWLTGKVIRTVFQEERE